VEAVQKTRAGIVIVKAQRGGDSGRPRESVGSGVIIDGRGYIVTNHHVGAGAGKMRVCLSDGTELSARAIAEEPGLDLVMLKVQTDRQLQALPLGPASDLLVGETVIAVGHPFGYTNTVSTGIVSALGRTIKMPTGETLTDLIQTNASINPGNSGGPLLNINGELIGIIVALRDGAQGIAFAINADAVKQALLRHLSAGKVAGVTHGLACAERVAPEGGRHQRVVVAEVGDRTPAASAGLKQGDEIVRLAGLPVANRFDVERALWNCRPGQEVDLTVVRVGRELTLGLRLAAEPEANTVSTSGG
jgi:serine protease Do